jgi:hypothetical protein
LRPAASRSRSSSRASGELINEIFLYVLALAASRHGVLVHGFCVRLVRARAKWLSYSTTNDVERLLAGDPGKDGTAVSSFSSARRRRVTR